MRFHEIITAVPLFEAKEIVDSRHVEPVGDGYIDPAHGFYFSYHEGTLILHSSKESYQSYKVTGIRPSKVVWNNLDGKVEFGPKTVTIQKVSVGDGYRQNTMANIKELQFVLRDLAKYGVTPEYKIKGVPPHVPKTVAGLMTMADPTDTIKQQKPIVMYHGTSMIRWQEIQRLGLAPGNTPNEYNDLIKNYSEHNIYLATTAKGAEFYGKRQAVKDGDSQYVVLAINVPDPAKILSDDRFNHVATRQVVPDPNDLDRNGKPITIDVPKSKEELTKQGSEGRRLSSSGRNNGEFAYRGRILPSHIKLIRVGKTRE